MAYQLFCDSFDTSTTIIPSRWVQSGVLANTSIEASAGRRGTSALKAVCIAGSFAAVTTVAVTPATHLVAGFWMKRTAASGTTSFSFLRDGTSLVSLSLLVSGVFSVTLGGTTYTSTYTYTQNTGVFVEIGVQIADSGKFYVKVNGNLVINLSSVDTKPSTITAVNQFQISQSNVINTAYFDDFTLTYGDELKWLGDVRVDALALTGDSTPQDWTPDTGNAWERLNNTSAGYITGTTLDDESLFTLADYSPQTTAIHGVQVSAYARKTDSGSRSMAIEVKSDTTTDVGNTIALGDSTTEYRQVWLTDPDTAAAWADGGLDALEIGVKVMD